MAGPAKRRATYQDVLDAPEHVVAEIVNGELRLSPRRGGPHTRATSILGADLLTRFDRGTGGPGGWIILDEPELHFTQDIVVPDIAGWRRERMPTVATGTYFTIAPDWICEALSRSTEAWDRAHKLPVYAAAGVTHVWLVNAIQHTLEILRRQGDKWLTVAIHHGDVAIRAEPFDSIELDLGSIWADVSAPPPRGSRVSESSEDYGG
jgi:Uma2 family endonuclease